MNKVMIEGQWKMRIVGEENWLAAFVPGSVYNDLIYHRRMEDPYYRDNELEALKIMEHDFEYYTCFEVAEAMLEEEEIILTFSGIDTVADIYLNGQYLAHVENMHRIWNFTVKKHLKRGINELKVILHSPTQFIRQAYEEDPLGGSEDAMRGFSKLRKAHCMFGWDWGPRLPDAGLWREVSLTGFSGARLDSVYVTQHHERQGGGCKLVTLKLQVKAVKSNEKMIYSLEKFSKKFRGYSFRAVLIHPDGKTIVYAEDENVIPVESPVLWWPNGYGGQALYVLRVELLQDGRIIDTWEKRIGLRTLTMHIQNDEYGKQFAHEVNGVKIFAMGADYIPEDNILSRVTKERTRQLLLDAKNVNFNCIRVWGGGYYPGDEFWDICDELGLIVWQDFMFACAVYHLDEEFEENIIAEFIDNIKRIRHHASLGLWCGNNEMEMFMENQNWPCHPQRISDYIKMYEYILPKILKEYDPNTFYWPASPSSGGSFDAPNDEKRGDVHYWDVWHGNKPITEYRKYYFRYVSEFGFQSFPALKTCETFTKPEDRNIFSYVMEKHQRNSTANGKIMNYMEQTFLYPSSFELVLYASQLLQAEAIRYGVEHFRRHRGRCMGTIIWQLNDCWPVASWSSIDYFGRWKALHYYAKRFFAPLMLSCEEEGILTQDINPNAEPYEVKKSIKLCVANETMKKQQVVVKWALRKNTAEILKEGSCELQAEELSSIWLQEEDMMEAEIYTDYVSYDMYQNGECISAGTVIFCAPKHYQFADPSLTVDSEGDELTIRANAYARSVEIINEADDMLLEDNYFDMNAGIRKIKILKGKPEGLKVRSVYNIR